jgi:hypothetical protein
MAEEKRVDVSEYRDLVAGNQSLILMLDPGGTWNYATDRHLGVDFIGPEWGALFYEVLDCPKPDENSFVSGESVSAQHERYRLEFQQAMPSYPMLSRIWDTYIDVKYKPEEISQLRDECQTVKAGTDNLLALEGLNKLIYACDEALKQGLGLYMACD